MKVLFTFGGLPHYYNPILNRLNRVVGVDIHVLVPKGKSDVLGKGVHQSTSGIEFTVHYLDEYKAYYGKNYFRGFIPFLKKEKPDIIVTGWPYVLGFILHPGTVLFFLRTKIKVILKEIPFQVPHFHTLRVFYKHGYFFTESDDSSAKIPKPRFYIYAFNALLRKMYYNRMDAFVNYVEEAYDIIGSYGIPREKIFITYNSPDTDVLNAINDKIALQKPILPPNPQRLIHIGRLVYWKRVDLLLQATALLKRETPDIESVIIGDGPEKDSLRQLASTLGIETNVRFIGSVYDAETIGKYLKASAVYVLAGMGGLSINEAMCFGKPVVCSVCDGTEKKLVRENVNGRYFQPGNEKDLARILRDLLAHPDMIDRMGKKSIDIIRNEVNVHIVIRGYLQAFSYVLNEPFTE